MIRQLYITHERLTRVRVVSMCRFASRSFTWGSAHWNAVPFLFPILIIPQWHLLGRKNGSALGSLHRRAPWGCGGRCAPRGAMGCWFSPRWARGVLICRAGCFPCESAALPGLMPRFWFPRSLSTKTAQGLASEREDILCSILDSLSAFACSPEFCPSTTGEWALPTTVCFSVDLRDTVT